MGLFFPGGPFPRIVTKIFSNIFIRNLSFNPKGIAEIFRKRKTLRKILEKF